MQKNVAIHKNFIFLTIIYTSLLLLSNVSASKISSFNNMHFTAVIIFFPITYIIDDILTEVYGFKASRIVIWGGLFANLFFIFGAYVVLKLPGADSWHGQNAFEQVFSQSPRIFIASLLAYFFGEFTNSVILAKLKVITKGKRLWLRAIGSTAIGALIDTAIFSFVAFSNLQSFDIIISMVKTEYVIKVLFEILTLPLVYMIVKYLKKADQIDYYDTKTDFNPFSFKL